MEAVDRVTRAFAVACCAMAIPYVALASSIESTFLTSSTGTAQIDVGDTIQFEVTITTNPNQNYTTLIWSLTGDAAEAVTSSQGSGWAGVLS